MKFPYEGREVCEFDAKIKINTACEETEEYFIFIHIPQYP